MVAHLLGDIEHQSRVHSVAEHHRHVHVVVYLVGYCRPSRCGVPVVTAQSEAHQLAADDVGLPAALAQVLLHARVIIYGDGVAACDAAVHRCRTRHPREVAPSVDARHASVVVVEYHLREVDIRERLQLHGYHRVAVAPPQVPSAAGLVAVYVDGLAVG